MLLLHSFLVADDAHDGHTTLLASKLPVCCVCMCWCAVHFQAGTPPAALQHPLGTRGKGVALQPGASLPNTAAGAAVPSGASQAANAHQPPARAGSPPTKLPGSKGVALQPHSTWPSPIAAAGSVVGKGVALQPSITCPQSLHNSTRDTHKGSSGSPGLNSPQGHLSLVILGSSRLPCPTGYVTQVLPFLLGG